jgi:hypothetical protein
VKNEPDPFEPTKSTFIAATVDDHGGLVGLAIRCLDGGLSLIVTNSASNAALGDLAHLKIVADGQPPRDEVEASVISSTTQVTVVQFGDETTVAYLKGAKKVSVRYTLGGMMLTETFGGGKSLDDIIQKAMNACGKSALLEPPPSVSTTAEPGSAEWNRASDAYPLGCQRGDLIRPTAASANPRMTPGRDHSVIGGAIISESGGGIIPLRGATSSWNWGAASSGISKPRHGPPSQVQHRQASHPFALPPGLHALRTDPDYARTAIAAPHGKVRRNRHAK